MSFRVTQKGRGGGGRWLVGWSGRWFGGWSGGGVLRIWDTGYGTQCAGHLSHVFFRQKKMCQDDVGLVYPTVMGFKGKGACLNLAKYSFVVVRYPMI